MFLCCSRHFDFFLPMNYALLLVCHSLRIHYYALFGSDSYYFFAASAPSECGHGGVSRHRNDLPVATTALLTLHSVHVPRPSLSPSICESIHCGCVAARPSVAAPRHSSGRAGGPRFANLVCEKASPVRTNGRTSAAAAAAANGVSESEATAAAAGAVGRS